MFGLYDNLPRSDEDLAKHLDALYQMTGSVEHKEIFDHLYECLSILDSKSAALLTFNAMVLVVYTINFANFGTYSGVSTSMLYLGVSMVTASAIFLLTIIWVRWSATRSLLDLRDHARTLLQVRKTRTVCFRIAWWLSMGATIVMVVFVWSVLPELTEGIESQGSAS